jgi:uncharacterized membrane protein YgcG
MSKRTGKRPRQPITHVEGEEEDDEDDILALCPLLEEVDSGAHSGRADDDDHGQDTRQHAAASATPEVADCGVVYASARRAAEEAFVHGANTVARPYQADAVAKLMSLVWLDRHAALTRPINYLVQHATGTGKSLTIAVLALTLLNLNSSGLVTSRSDEKDEGGGRGGIGDGCGITDGGVPGGGGGGGRGAGVFSTGETSQTCTPKLAMDRPRCRHL